jgi:hypothetical protein
MVGVFAPVPAVPEVSVSPSRFLLVALLLVTLGWSGPVTQTSAAEAASMRTTRAQNTSPDPVGKKQTQVITSRDTARGRSNAPAHGRGGSKTQPPPSDPEPTPDPTPPADPEPGPSEPTPTPLGDRFHLGITNGAVPDRPLTDEVVRLTGEEPSLLLWYVGFGQEIRGEDVAAVRAAGGIPVLTWEPYDWTRGIDQPEYRLERIVDGTYDDYLRRSARTLRDVGDPVLLRFAHEMNGGWYPWSESANGNRAGDYVRAWRHVHDLFRAEGADNVSWMWSPNVEFPGSQPLDGLYPGARYVDVVGIDGYNWGTSRGEQAWQRPDEIFDATMATVRRLVPGTPIVLAEVGSTELGGDKAVWNGQLFAWMANQPDLAGFVWFQLDKETDWRIDSSASSAAAFRDGLAGLRQARH